METSQKTMKSGTDVRNRLALVITCAGVMVALLSGQAVSSSNKDGETGEKHESSRNDSKFYGTVEKLPADRIGTWTVSGREIVVSKETRFKEEYGKAAAGSYVEVEGTNTGKKFSASKIEVKRAKK